MYSQVLYVKIDDSGLCSVVLFPYTKNISPYCAVPEKIHTHPMEGPLLNLNFRSIV